MTAISASLPTSIFPVLSPYRSAVFPVAMAIAVSAGIPLRQEALTIAKLIAACKADYPVGASLPKFILWSPSIFFKS